MDMLFSVPENSTFPIFTGLPEAVGISLNLPPPPPPVLSSFLQLIENNKINDSNTIKYIILGIELN